MGLFAKLFGEKTKPLTSAPPINSPEWRGVASQLAGLLWITMNTDRRSMLLDKGARIVLMYDWNVGLATAMDDPSKLLGPDDVTCVSIHSERAALDEWVEELKIGAPIPLLQQAATEKYAETLVHALRQNMVEAFKQLDGK